MPDKIRISGIAAQSIVDGPGLRFVVFAQGCPHNCPGCHNPQTHDFDGGFNCSTIKLLELIDSNPLLSGVTFSGGEPFCRADELVPLAKAVKSRGKNLLCYSGYTFEQLLDLSKANSDIFTLLELTDILVDGPFVLSQRDLTLRFRGSKNQRILNVCSSIKKGSAVLAVLPD